MSALAGDERLEFAALAGWYGLDPERVLDERDPTRQAMDRVYVAWADQLRHDRQQDQAVRNINQLGTRLR